MAADAYLTVPGHPNRGGAEAAHRDARFVQGGHT